MSYNFEFIVSKNIGKLSWGMIVSPKTEKVRVIVGEQVETTETFFVAGVWDGDFMSGEFETAEMFCGSGAKISEGKILASSSTHERQRICYMNKAGFIYVSNSVPFILALTKESLDVNCNEYEAIFCSIINGLQDYEKDIPLATGKVMHQIFSSDLIIDGEGVCEVRRKALHRDFVNYNDYLSSMKKVCSKILSNGQDLNRVNKLEMIATTSSGYDSSSCAAVVHEIGCDIACTFKDGKYDEDSGASIAKKIGYKTIVEASCYDYKSQKDNLDAVFFVDGDLGFFMPFDGFREQFENKIVVTGISGGYMWDRDSRVNPDSKRYGYYYYLTNISFCEHSLQCGYIMLPLVLYGSTAAVSVNQITNSKEMEPWTINSSYDRPIPRRILETAGVERGTFATADRGAGISFSRNFSKKQIKEKMTCEGYDSFIKWLNTKGNNRWTVIRIAKMIRYHFSTIPEYLDFVFSKLKIHTKFSKHHENLCPNPGIPSKMIIWANECISVRYSNALDWVNKG